MFAEHCKTCDVSASKALALELIDKLRIEAIQNGSAETDHDGLGETVLRQTGRAKRVGRNTSGESGRTNWVRRMVDKSIRLEPV